MASRKRTVILISGRGSNMRALVEAAGAADFPAEIAGVISNRPAAAGLDYAREQGLPAVALDHTAFDGREAFDRRLGEEIERLGGELVALAGFMRIIGPQLARAWAGRMLNIHPSLLPSYRGLDTHERALADGVRLAGCTVHFVVPELDAGPIVAQAAVPVLASDTADTLAGRVLKVEHKLYPAALRLVASGRARLDGTHVVFADEDAALGDRTLLSV